MSAQEYCRQKAAPPGSNFHYSTLYHPAPIRRSLFALHALAAEVSQVIEECSDPGVARMKLAWWHEEIGRMAAGQARHPAGQELQAVLDRYAVTRDHLHALVQHTEARLELRQPESYEALLAFLREGPGLLWRLSADICGYQSPATPAICGEIGCSLAVFELLHQLRRDIARGSLFLPVDEMADAGLAAGDLFEPGGVNVRDFFALQIDRVGKGLEDCCTRLPSVDRRHQRHSLIMARLVIQTCREIARDGYRPAQHRVALTPLRKLWIAWRIKRGLSNED